MEYREIKLMSTCISSYWLDIISWMVHKPLKINTSKMLSIIFPLSSQRNTKAIATKVLLSLQDTCSQWVASTSTRLSKSEIWKSPLTPQSSLAPTSNLSASPFRLTYKWSISSIRLCAWEEKNVGLSTTESPEPRTVPSIQ